MVLALGFLLALVTLPGTVQLLFLTLGAVARRRRPATGGETPRWVVVIPAHDETATIARAVESVRRSDPALAVWVVADNCGDDTADRARAAGAEVLVRDEPTRRGKPYALELAFGVAMERGYDAVAVVDADSVVSSEFAPAVGAALAAGADAVQVRYGVLNPNESLRTLLLHVGFLSSNLLRPRGRHAWGLSAGLLGNGFALSRATLEAVPFTTRSLTEDLAHHLDLVRAGRRVEFVEQASVRAEMPSSRQGWATQRARWEGGRLRLLRTEGPRLLSAVVRGRWRQLEPLLDLVTAPLAFHSLLLVGAFAAGEGTSRWLATAGLVVLTLHVVAALVIGRARVRDVAALGLAPFYALWKLTGLVATLRASRSHARWVRTERRDGAGDGTDTMTPYQQSSR